MPRGRIEGVGFAPGLEFAEGAAGPPHAGRRLVLTAIPAARQQRPVQIWAISGSIGATGSVLGGLLVQESWRSIFAINLPVGVAALAVTAVPAASFRHGTETGGL